MNIYLETYGCTANKSDASLIQGILKKNGYNISKDVNNADVLIILTCTVINTTEQRMLSRIRELKKTGKQIIIAGCMASVQSELIQSIDPNARFLPPQYSYQINELIENDKINFELKNKTLFPKYYNELVAPIAIAEGCRLNCSYCITSIARGKLRSYPANEIIKDIENALGQGCKEIQITAQDTAAYGLDLGKNLGDLLKEISKIKSGFRVRVGMMNPYHLLKNINSILDGFNSLKIYKFLHIPIQSGDNEILKKMNRKYTINDFYNIIKKFRDKYPNITISTDIIVGFPSETDEQFKKSIKLINEIKPDITNITRFSARPLTKAKKMSGRIPTEIVKKRSKIITEITKKVSEENNKKYIGKEFLILITEKGKNNSSVGRTSSYKPVVVKGQVELGKFIYVEVISAKQTHLVARLI